MERSATVLALAYVCVKSHGNLAIGALRLTGSANITSALRHNSRDPTRPLTIFGIPCVGIGPHDTCRDPGLWAKGESRRRGDNAAPRGHCHAIPA